MASLATPELEDARETSEYPSAEEFLEEFTRGMLLRSNAKRERVNALALDDDSTAKMRADEDRYRRETQRALQDAERTWRRSLGRRQSATAKSHAPITSPACRPTATCREPRRSASASSARRSRTVDRLDDEEDPPGVPCAGCNGPFEPTRRQLGRIAQGEPAYCSKRCADAKRARAARRRQSASAPGDPRDEYRAVIQEARDAGLIDGFEALELAVSPSERVMLALGIVALTKQALGTDPVHEALPIARRIFVELDADRVAA